MATAFDDFSSYSAGAVDTVASPTWSVQAAGGGNWTRNIVDDSGDKVLQITRSSSAAATNVVVYDGLAATAGDIEVVAKFKVDMSTPSVAAVGPVLVAADNRSYGLSLQDATTVRLYRFAATQGTASAIAAAISFSVPDQSYIWVRVGRSGSTISASIWLDGNSDPGFLTSGPEATLTTVKAGVVVRAVEHVPVTVTDFGVGTEGAAAPTSAGGGGGTVNTNTLESTLAVNDEALDYMFFNRLGEDTLVLTDELISTVIGTVAKILTDTIAVTDGSVFSVYRNRLLQDTITISEGATEQYTTTNLVADDVIDVVDSLIRYAQFNRLGTDSLVVTDSLISAIVNYVIQTAVLSSTISLTDSEQHFVYVTRLVESTLALFDESQSQLMRFILLSDALSVDDSAVATYVPDGGAPGTVYNPVIRVGFDQPRIDLGGYSLN